MCDVIVSIQRRVDIDDERIQKTYCSFKGLLVQRVKKSNSKGLLRLVTNPPLESQTV